MTGTVTSFTVIHTGGQGPEAAPYAVVVAQIDEGASHAARADGDLSWLAIGASVQIVEGDDGGPAVCVQR